MNVTLITTNRFKMADKINVTKQRSFNNGDATRSAETLLKDKLADFFSGLSNGNSNIVSKIERMIHEQQDEIELLTSRIQSLNRQIERQKEYYKKREDILKEMYEEELSLIENAYEANSIIAVKACASLGGVILNPSAPNLAAVRTLQPPHPPSGKDQEPTSRRKSADDTDCDSISKSEASTQIFKPTTVDATTSPEPVRIQNAACSATSTLDALNLLSKSTSTHKEMLQMIHQSTSTTQKKTKESACITVPTDCTKTKTRATSPGAVTSPDIESTDEKNNKPVGLEKAKSLGTACSALSADSNDSLSNAIRSEIHLPSWVSNAGVFKEKLTLNPNKQKTPSKVKSLNFQHSSTLIAKEVQSEPILQNDADDISLTADYQTCRDDSPLRLAGDILENQLKQELEGDEALVEVEKLHDKTRYLYSKLHAVMREFHGSSKKHNHLIKSKSCGSPKENKLTLKPNSSAPNIGNAKSKGASHPKLPLREDLLSISPGSKTNGENKSFSRLNAQAKSRDSSTEISESLVTECLVDHEQIVNSNSIERPPKPSLSNNILITDASSKPSIMVQRKYSLHNSVGDKKSLLNLTPSRIENKFLDLYDSTLNSDVSTIKTMTCGH